MVVENNRRDGDEESRSRGDERFGNARSNGAEACGAGVPETRKGVNDAPNGAEETDEGSDGTGCGQPGHALFDAANFFRGGELHADGDGLKAL